MRKLIVLILLMQSCCFASDVLDIDFSDKINRLNQLYDEIRAEDNSKEVAEVIDLWKYKREFLEKLKSEKDVSLGTKKGFENFSDRLGNVLWAGARNNPEIRQIYLDEFIETGSKHYASLYVRSSDDFSKAIVELYNERKDRSLVLAEEVFNRVQMNSSNPESYVRMTDELFEMIVDSIKSNPLDSQGTMPARYTLTSPHLVYDLSISEDEYKARVVKVLLDYAVNAIKPESDEGPDPYSFGCDDDKDSVLTDRYIAWYFFYERFHKFSGYTLDNLKKNTPEEEGFYKTYVLSLRASLGDKTVKEDLKRGLPQVEDLTARAYLLGFFAKIADIDDVGFLKSMKAKDKVFELPESAKNRILRITLQNEREQKKDKVPVYREEIYPVTEAVDRIFKKIGYSEKK